MLRHPEIQPEILLPGVGQCERYLANGRAARSHLIGIRECPSTGRTWKFNIHRDWRWDDDDFRRFSFVRNRLGRESQGIGRGDFRILPTESPALEGPELVHCSHGKIVRRGYGQARAHFAARQPIWESIFHGNQRTFEFALTP